MAISKADKPAIRTQVRAWVEKRVAVTFTGVTFPAAAFRTVAGPPPSGTLDGRTRHVQFVLSYRTPTRQRRVRRRRDARRGARRALEQARECLRRALARRPSAASCRPACAPCGAGTSRPRRRTRARRRAAATRAASTMRRKTSCWVSAGVKARKSCSPSNDAGTGRERLLGDRARPVPRARRAQRGGRPRAQHAVLVAAGERREARVEPLGRVRAAQHGDIRRQVRVERRRRRARSPGPPSAASTVTTCAEACTPVSVRPATAGRPLCGQNTRSASVSTPSTVRRPGCAAQP